MTNWRLQVVYGFSSLSIVHHLGKGNEPVERYCQKKKSIYVSKRNSYLIQHKIFPRKNVNQVLKIPKETIIFVGDNH